MTERGNCDKMLVTKRRKEKMKNYSKARKAGIFLLAYTLLFVGLASWLSYVFAQSGKTFIWNVDGAFQHVVVLKYIRQALITFFTTGKFAMVDYTIGQGFDVIGTLNYYGLGDPVTLLTVFFPKDSLELTYQILALVRMYLSGLAVAYLCKTIGRTNIYSVLPASLLYAFSGFALIGGIRHPMFFCGLMYLPLLIAGVEKIIKNKKIGTLAMVVAFAFASNYYFMYMSTIMAAIYFFVRQIGMYKSEGIKKLFVKIGKIILAYIWGIAMAAVILFPSVYAFLNNQRNSAKLVTPPLIGSSKYFKMMFKSMFVSSSALNDWCLPGIGILGILGIIIIIANWKKSDRKIILGFLIILLMLCSPYVGKVMNGFSYPTMRFSYGMVLVLSIMLAISIDRLKEIKKIPAIVSSILMLVAGVIAFLIGKTQRKPFVCYEAAILAIIATIILVVYFLIRNKKYSYILLYGMTLVAAINIACNSYGLFSSKELFTCATYVDRGNLDNYMGINGAKVASEIKDDSFYRIERDIDMKNSSTYFGFNQPGFYWSVIPSGMSDLYVSTGISNYYKTYVMKGLETRSGLMALAGIKYYVTYGFLKPYGFEKIDTKVSDGVTYNIYENKYALPLGVTYSNYMTREQYDKLSLVEKEYALLGSAVVDNKVDGIENKSKSVTVKKLPLKVEKINKVKIKKKKKINQFKMKAHKGGIYKCSFDGEKNSQSYIVFDNVYAKDTSVDRHAAKFNSRHGYGRLRVIGTKTDNYFVKRGNVLNLGYSKEEQNQFRLKFYKKRKYYFKDAYAVTIPISEYANRINKLKENTLENVKMDTNLITGTIKADKDEILQLSVPYSKGYTVYVDGKKTDTFSSSIAYLGVKLSKGNHNIRVEYMAPFFIPGLIVTILSVLIFLGYLLQDIAKKRSLKLDKKEV